MVRRFPIQINYFIGIIFKFKIKKLGGSDYEISTVKKIIRKWENELIPKEKCKCYSSRNDYEI